MSGHAESLPICRPYGVAAWIWHAEPHTRCVWQLFSTTDRKCIVFQVLTEMLGLGLDGWHTKNTTAVTSSRSRSEQLSGRTTVSFMTVR